jgi:MFS family permease
MSFASAAASDGYVAFRYRDFRLHCCARLLYGGALSMQAVAIGWYIYSLTRDPFALGIAGLSSFLPAASLSLFTGHIADVYNRRVILTMALLTSSLASLSLFLIAYTGGRHVGAIYACLLIAGVARAFANPSAQALTPNLVPKEHFANAITWYSSAWSAARIAGPALGGLLYIFGPTVPFLIAFVSIASAATCIFSIRNPGPTRKTGAAVTWTTLSAGLNFIRSRKVILGSISLDLFAVLFGGATALLPIIAQDVMHTGPWGLGLLRSSPALGAILMGTFLAHSPIRGRAGKKMLIAVGVYGLATILFGLSDNLLLSMGLLTMVGAADQISVVVRHTVVQSETPDDMRGRVAAVNSVFVSGASDLGEFESGVTAGWFGAIPAILLGGVATIACAVVWAKMFPALRDRDKLVE